VLYSSLVIPNYCQYIGMPRRTFGMSLRFDILIRHLTSPWLSKSIPGPPSEAPSSYSGVSILSPDLFTYPGGHDPTALEEASRLAWYYSKPRIKQYCSVIDKPIKKFEVLRAAAPIQSAADWFKKVLHTARKLEWDAFELARRSVRLAG
jgi:hypothetical protein